MYLSFGLITSSASVKKKCCVLAWFWFKCWSFNVTLLWKILFLPSYLCWMIASFKLIIVYSSWIFLIASESYLISDFLKLDIQNTKPGDVGGSCILFFVFFCFFLFCFVFFKSRVFLSFLNCSLIYFNVVKTKFQFT